MKCDVNGCNSIAESAFLTRSRCLSCLSSVDGEECEEGTLDPVLCEANNGCYTRVDDGVLERGCLAELDEISEQKCLDVSDTSCIVCEEPSCNALKWLKCIKCKKSLNPLCANPLETSLEDISSFCSKYDSQGACYSRATEFDLERGCSLELPNPALVCDDTVGCVTCLQSNCNDQPEDSFREGVKCVQCSSSDSDCNGLTLPDPKQCPSTNLHCFTRIDEGKLERGCLSSLSQELQENCKDANNPSCIVCTEDGCNTQKWPRCYRCTSSSDESCDTSLNTDHLNFCDAYTEHNICHSWIQDGEISRDCTIDKETVCADNNRCLVCEAEGCNSHSRELLDTVHTCYHCSSSTDECDQLEGTGTECGRRSDRCYTRVTDGVLIRGCLSEMDSEEECLSAPASQCVVCNDNDCNQQRWNACYQCSNTTNSDCADEQKNQSEPAYCSRYDANGECYVSLNEGHFTRGCLLDHENESCDDPWQCVSCTGSGCNEGSSESYFGPAYCLQCRSDTHRECLNETMEPVKCGNPADLCFYRRVTSRIIERGCFSDLSPVLQTTCSSTSSRSCLTCSGSNCNGVQWSRCYQCSSFLAAKCELLQSDETHLQLCLNAADHCFEDRDGEEIHRGCGEFYCDHKKTCVECVGDGCNGNAGSTLLPSRCTVCDTTDPTCVNGSHFDVYCDYIREPCYSMVRADGILERGCFFRLDDSLKGNCLDQHDRSCIVCSWNTCNRAHGRQCTQCTSTEHGVNCSREASPMKGNFCKHLQHYDRCYAKDVDGVVTRGCVSDFGPTEDVCYGLTKTECFTCASDNCNDRSLNAALRITNINFRELLPTVLLLLVTINKTLMN
ncbi:protein psiR-like [Anopheles darlingi]|uniref:protein psiR-like n=1 Tax=Anopheles darlingi TaxID=43151 RepID=UPI0021000E6F|nr:protein psiR-like [Anopheles darlingi]